MSNCHLDLTVQFYIVSDASSYYSSASSSLATRISSDVASVTSLVGSVLSSIGVDVYETVTGELYRHIAFFDPLTHSLLDVGGKEYTILTSVNGPAYTLTSAGAGVVTSVYGGVYTVATGAPASTTTGPGQASTATGSAASSAVHSSSAAFASPSLGFTSSHAVGIATMLVGTLIGALITL